METIMLSNNTIVMGTLISILSNAINNQLYTVFKKKKPKNLNMGTQKITVNLHMLLYKHILYNIFFTYTY